MIFDFNWSVFTLGKMLLENKFIGPTSELIQWLLIDILVRSGSILLAIWVNGLSSRFSYDNPGI